MLSQKHEMAMAKMGAYDGKYWVTEIGEQVSKVGEDLIMQGFVYVKEFGSQPVQKETQLKEFKPKNNVFKLTIAYVEIEPKWKAHRESIKESVYNSNSVGWGRGHERRYWK